MVMVMVVVMVIVMVRVMVIVITGKRPNAVRPGARGAWTQLEQAWWIDEKQKYNCLFAAFANLANLLNLETGSQGSLKFKFLVLNFFTTWFLQRNLDIAWPAKNMSCQMSIA